jgi:hypothetical protein
MGYNRRRQSFTLLITKNSVKNEKHYKMKQFIRSLIPPIFLIVLNKLRNNKYGWKGDYSSWQEAREASTGYDSNEILQAVRNSLLKVKNGEAVYERDSVIFDEIQYSWPLLAGLMFAASKMRGGSKCVILVEV